MGNLTIKIEHKRSVYLSGFFVEKSCLKKIKKFFSIRKDLSYWSFILEAETKEDKKYYYSIIRGKRYDRKGEVRADFGVKNIKTGNCAIIEIKDAKQELVTTYRTGEYRISNALAGAISQVLKQKDTLYKDYWQNATEGHGGLAFSANNIKSILIIGTMPQNSDEIKTFDTFRNELKGIEIRGFACIGVFKAA